MPRPDLASVTGAPDACTACHRDRAAGAAASPAPPKPPGDAAAWAARAIASWGTSEPRPPHWGEWIAAAWRGEPGADARLAAAAGEDLPPIVRATALSLLPGTRSAGGRAAIEHGVADPSGLVRLGALRALESAPLEDRVTLAAPLLHDPLLAVRAEAARLLAAAPGGALSQTDVTALDAALAEYRVTQEVDADRPESRVNLGNLALERGDAATAEKEYRSAIRLDPTFTPAQVNLADVLRATGRDEEAASVLRAAIARTTSDGTPRDASEATLHHALGLALVRLGRQDEAMVELERAVEAAPDEPRYAYVLGVALHSRGLGDQAVALLERAHRRWPADAEVLSALAAIERERGNAKNALAYARKLAAIDPSDAGAQALVRELEVGQ